MPGTARDVVPIAAKEVDVHWQTNEHRILEYFKASTGQVWTKQRALTQSWCTHFVMWVLTQAGITPLPQVGTPPPESFSTARFMKRFSSTGVYDAYPAAGGKYTPKPGDLYYLPHHNDHIGVIEVVSNAGGPILITTINGNGFDMAHIRFSELVNGKTIMGGGFVSRGSPANLLDGKSEHRDAMYISLPAP